MDEVCPNCKNVTERNRRYILGHSGSSICFCSLECLVIFYNYELLKMGTYEVFSEWCVSVLDAFNEVGYTTTLSKLIVDKKVMSLANYLKKHRHDLPAKDCKTCRKLESQSCHTCVQNDHYSDRWESK